MRYAIGLIAAIVIYLVLTRFYANQPKPQAPQTFATTNDMMVHFGTEAAKWMKKDKGIDLDYSLDSIKVVEARLNELAKKVDKDKPENTIEWAVIYGAYLGEIIRRREGGFWDVDHPIGGPRTYPMTTTNNSIYFPVVWSWVLLTGGASESFIQEELAKARTNQTGTLTLPTNTPPIPAPIPAPIPVPVPVPVPK